MNKNNIKIYATSDLHGHIEGLNPSGYDICIIAGDIEPSELGVDPNRWLVNTFVPWVMDHQDTQFVLIPGNHDFYAPQGNRIFQWVDNLHFIIDEQIEVCGLRIYGTPWVPYINGNWIFEANDEEELRDRFNLIPNGIDILVTHTPPLIKHRSIDVSLQHKNGSPHFGSKALLEAIVRTKPSLLFCGHIHSGDHNANIIESDGTRTLAFNVSRLDERYDISYSPCTMEINDGRVIYNKELSPCFVSGEHLII